MMGSHLENTASFLYKVGFRKDGNKYHIMYYNSPYKSSEQELDDICAFMDGKSVQGTNIPGYKTIQWEKLLDGEYEVLVDVIYTPNLENDGTYDQSFRQRELKSLENK